MGFKSFLEKTVFKFDQGVTCIVGPNGCGKSNVVDAIRWCMGEQSAKRLRGRGMDDVIFAGAEGRDSVGMAEVSLVFDNSDRTAPAEFNEYNEIQITRRLYRSGESEYLLNKTSCRLKDVQDFFRDTGIGTKGYTIVEQGQIAGIVSAKPEERRMLIEEAAGISKYRARRREAESKLKSTEQNLLRVSDVLAEIKRQISSLERQAKKAARYKLLRESLRTLELSLAHDDRCDLVNEVETIRSELVKWRDQATACEAQVAERELHIQELRLELAERETALNQASEALFALRSELRELEAQIGFARRERESLAEANAQRQIEIARLREHLQGAEAEFAQATRELEALKAEIAGEAESLRQATVAAEHAAEVVRTLERERQTANQVFIELLTRIARSEDRTASLEDRLKRIEQRRVETEQELQAAESDVLRANEEQTALEQGVSNLRAEREAIRLALDAARARHEAQILLQREAQEALRGARDTFEFRKARLASLQEVIERGEDVGSATRYWIEQGEAARTAHGMRAMVREVFEAEREVEVAVESVLADRAEAFIIEHPEGALSALETLHSAKAGRGVFVLDRCGGAGMQTDGIGVPLLQHLRVSPGYECVAEALLGDVRLVDDLQSVLTMFPHGALPGVFVTRSGDVLTEDRVVRGGAGSSDMGQLARVREVRELSVEVAALGQALQQQTIASRDAEGELAMLADEVDRLRSRLHNAELAVANCEKDLERTRERGKALGKLREGRASEREQLVSEGGGIQEETARLHASLAAWKQERDMRQTQLDELLTRIGVAAHELAQKQEVLTECRIGQDARLETQRRTEQVLARTQATAQETREWIARREADSVGAEERRGALAETMQVAEEQLAQKLREEEAARLASEEKRNQYEQEMQSLQTLENELRELRAKLYAAQEGAQATELKSREAELRLQHLEESIREKWNVEIATWTPPVLDAQAMEARQLEDVSSAEEWIETELTDGADLEPPTVAEQKELERLAKAQGNLLTLSIEERRQQLKEVRRKLEALGEVNLGAIEEHEELRERYRFLSEQKADLDNTIQSLREAIQRINRTSRQRFRETFDIVNAKFQANFPRLFRGGRASLQLTEGEDVLEAGVEIMAQPPGKRLQSVTLLSGGEKTMTALALLVSLFQVRSSPFFLLDEVDAALDDANVGRFNEIVAEMSKESQFLVITHNKRTIELGDVLYGVTMEQRGVSRLVSVDLHS